MAENTQKENPSINYSTDVVINGQKYFQSLAHQLANHICEKKYDEFRLTSEKGFTSAKFFIEEITAPGNLYTPTKYGKKKCIGVVLFDIENNRMILRKTNVDRSVHEFRADGKLDDCFGVQYEVFKYLRDGDIIQIHTTEKEGRRKVPYKYRIKKMKALKNGRFLHFKGYGTQFFIPVADFYREAEKRRPKKG